MKRDQEVRQHNLVLRRFFLDWKMKDVLLAKLQEAYQLALMILATIHKPTDGWDKLKQQKLDKDFWVRYGIIWGTLPLALCVASLFSANTYTDFGASISFLVTAFILVAILVALHAEDGKVYSLLVEQAR